MEYDDLPPETSGGKPSYEARKLREAYIACKDVLNDPNADESEKKAMLFYLDQLKDVHPCADENKFVKFRKGIGGTGDTIVYKSYVVRDHKTKKPLLNEKGDLVIIKCAFKDLAGYLDTIKSRRAESLRRCDGVWPLSESDKKYAAPDPYAYLYDNMRQNYGR